MMIIKPQQNIHSNTTKHSKHDDNQTTKQNIHSKHKHDDNQTTTKFIQTQT